MGDTTKVHIGVCTVYAGNPTTELGYTKGFVKAKYQQYSAKKYTDFYEAPVDEILTKKNFEVDVPLAELDFQKLSMFFPGATFIENASYGNAMELAGNSQSSLMDLSSQLMLVPDENDFSTWLTLWHAIPIPSISYSYEKENVRVYNVKFRAMVGADGRWVTWGSRYS